MSPWVGACFSQSLSSFCSLIGSTDLTRSCDSWDSNAPFDIVPIPSNGDHMDPVACYLGSNMELYLTHPYASPLFGDFTGLPPMLIQAGESEVLRDEVTLLAHKATLSGVQVMHELYEDAVSLHVSDSFLVSLSTHTFHAQIHVFQAFPFLEASHHAFSSCRAFVRHGFAIAQPQDPRPLDDHTEAELANEIDNERAHMVRGDGQDKVPSNSSVRDDSEQDAGDTTEDESDSSYVSADESLPVSEEEEEEDGSRSKLAVKAQGERRAGDDWDEGPSNLHKSSYPRSRRVQSYHGLEHALHIPSLMWAQHPSSLRNHAATLNPRHLRMSTLSSAPVPSPSIRSSSSHPDISSLCEQWESTGPANVTLTYKPSGTTISASSSKSKGRKRSPTFHHT
jgi:hypothetical protein